MSTVYDPYGQPCTSYGPRATMLFYRRVSGVSASDADVAAEAATAPDVFGGGVEAPPVGTHRIDAVGFHNDTPFDLNVFWLRNPAKPVENTPTQIGRNRIATRSPPTVFTGLQSPSMGTSSDSLRRSWAARFFVHQASSSFTKQPSSGTRSSMLEPLHPPMMTSHHLLLTAQPTSRMG